MQSKAPKTKKNVKSAIFIIYNTDNKPDKHQKKVQLEKLFSFLVEFVKRAERERL